MAINSVKLAELSILYRLLGVVTIADHCGQFHSARALYLLEEAWRVPWNVCFKIGLHQSIKNVTCCNISTTGCV